MEAIKETELSSESPFPVDVFISDNLVKRVNVPIHWHECVEIHYILDGKASQQINNQHLAVKKNDIIVINPGDVHGITCDYGNKCRILVIKFLPRVLNMNYVSTLNSRYIFAFLNHNLEKVYHINDTFKNSKNIYNLMMGISDEFLSKEPGYELLLKGYIYQLIGYLVRFGLIDDPDRYVPYEKHLASLEPLIKYVEENYREDIDLEHAARIMNLSYYYASRYFKRVTGRNFKEYIDFTRASEAERLIVSKDLNITQAAYEVGFSNVSAFCRVFKRIKGYSPGTLKRANTV